MDYRRRAEVVRSMPIRMWIESSSFCNLACPMCPNSRMPADRKGLMDVDLFRKIVDEARDFASDVNLHHRGEPFMNPALFDMIAYARGAGLNARFHSNGSLMNEERAGRLLDAGPDLVSFSVDGFEKASYERIRVNARFETTVENIVRLVEMRRRRGLKKPYVVVEKIRFRSPDPAENRDRVRALWRRFLDAGVNEVIEKEEYTWAEESAPEAARQRRFAVCTFPWYAMVICADGTVTPCPQDFWAAMNMGNLSRQSIREVWNGEAYRRLRRDFRTDINRLALCRKCDRLHRRTVAGVPFQYMITFLVDQLVGYNRMRKWLGTSERNV
ncbi:MAG: radical SAM protein [Lentisphaerae bacterium]|nr:radical SAM protein [Lentisphaerota bacterium]